MTKTAMFFLVCVLTVMRSHSEGLLCKAEKAVAFAPSDQSNNWVTEQADQSGFFLTVTLEEEEGFSVSGLGETVPYFTGEQCDMLGSETNILIACDSVMSSFRMNTETTRFSMVQFLGLSSRSNKYDLVSMVGRCTGFFTPQD